MNNLPLILLGGGVVYFMLNKNKSSSAQKSETPEIKADLKKEVPKPKPLPKKTNPNPPPVEIPKAEVEKKIDLNSGLGVSLYNTDEPGIYSVIKDPVGNINYKPLMNVKIYTDQPAFTPLPLVVFIGPMNGVFNDSKSGPWVRDGEDEMLKNLAFPESARYSFIKPLSASNQHTLLNEMISVQELGLYPKENFNLYYELPAKAALETILAIYAIKKAFPTTKIYIVGYSSGAAIAYSIAQFTRRNLKNFPDISGILLVRGFYYSDDYNYGKIVSEGSPITSIHGLKDSYVNFKEGLNLYNQYKGPKLGFISVPFVDNTLEQLKPAINQSLKALMTNT